MSHTVSEIARAMGAEFVGDGSLIVRRLAEPSEAGPDDLAMAMNPKYGPELAKGHARAAAVWPGADWKELNLEAAIFVTRPRLALSAATGAFEIAPNAPAGIHPTAQIDPSAEVGVGASIGAFTVIGPGVRIGARARIMSHVIISRDVQLGDDALIHAGVKLGERVRIGDRFIAQPGAVIGGDGFSFVTAEKSSAEKVRETLSDAGSPASDEDTAQGGWIRIASLGAVEIGDDVEIGANSSIDRGTIRSTRIGRGTKIDSMVQIGHNVQVGEDCLLCGQVGVGGSTRIGNRVVLGGQAGLNDNITLGDDVVVGGGSSLVSNVASGKAVWGFPATRMDQTVETYKALRRLPRLFRQVAELQKQVSNKLKSD